jgi:nucleotide-binding universal stress UspA family protein
MFERLVVAYDGSERAGAAAELAFELARRKGARLTLAYVLELPVPHPEVPEAVPGIERAEEEWRSRLAALAAGAPDGASVETEVLVANKAGPALLELLREHRADVLVGGSSACCLGASRCEGGGAARGRGGGAAGGSGDA